MCGHSASVAYQPRCTLGRGSSRSGESRPPTIRSLPDEDLPRHRRHRRDPDRRPLGRPRRRHDQPDALRQGRRHDVRRDPPGDLQDHARARSRPRSSPTTSRACSTEGRHFAKLAPNIVVKVADERERPRGDQPLRRGGHQDQLHADLHGQPGPPRGQGRRLAPVAVRRPARRHQPGRDDRHPRAGRDRRRSTSSTPRSSRRRSATRST